MSQLHTLTSHGIERFQSFIDSQLTTEPESFDLDLLTDPRFAQPIGEPCDVPETCDFASRFEAAEAVSVFLSTAGLADPASERGVWCWLSWLWFESLCPRSSDGKRKPGESARWVLNLSYDRYYRHLLAGPWFIYDRHKDDPDRARALLCNEVTKLGELSAQIAAYQELVSNAGLVGMLTKLLFDPEKGKLRRGVGGKGPGSARRLVVILDQLATIWDLYSTSTDEFITLLPKEFDRYKVSAS